MTFSQKLFQSWNIGKKWNDSICRSQCSKRKVLLWPEVQVAEVQVVPGPTYPTAWGNQYRHNLPVAHPQPPGWEVLNRMLLLNYILLNCNLWGKNTNSALLYIGFVTRQALTTWWQRWLPALGFPYSQLSIQSRIKIASLLLVWNHRISHQDSDLPQLGLHVYPQTRHHDKVDRILWPALAGMSTALGTGRLFVWRCGMMVREGDLNPPEPMEWIPRTKKDSRFCIPDKGKKQKPAGLTVITAHYGACGYWKHHVSI